MPPWYNYNWRDWRAPSWDMPVKTAFVAAEKAYIWRMHLHTPRYMRKELHQQLAVKYNCSIQLVADCIAERGPGWSPSPPPTPGSHGSRGSGRGRGGSKGKGKDKEKSKGKARAQKLLAAPEAAVAADVQGREVEAAMPKLEGGIPEAAGAAEAGPSRPSAHRRRSSGYMYIEVSTIAEVRAAYRASRSATSSSGDSSGPKLRRSARARTRSGKTQSSASVSMQDGDRASAGEVTSSSGDPSSVAPATTSSSKPSSARASQLQGDFRTFLEELHLDRIVPIFAEYGFRTAEDVKFIREMAMDTRKQLFEWLLEDGKINLKELAILHENLIAKK